MQLSREELLKAYRDMATIRQFEERVQDEFMSGKIRSPLKEKRE